MAKHVRVAERITDFSQDDFETISKSNPLIINGRAILRRYTKEFPIVVYQENKEFADDTMFYKLNERIGNIFVSVARYEIGEEYRVIAYYEDTEGENYIICNREIFEFLLKKPYLTISPDGVLLFYTDQAIMATTDLEHYCWIENDRLSMNEDTYIHKIMVNYLDLNNPFCEISLIESEPGYIDQKTHTLIPGKKYDKRYSITIHIDESGKKEIITEINALSKRRL